MAAERSLTPGAVRDIAAQHVAGATNRSIAAQYDVAHTTVGRLLRRPEVATEIGRLRSEASAVEQERDEAVRAEKIRADNRERQARKAVRDRHVRNGAAPDANPQTPHAERPTIAQQSRRNSADGRVLGVVRGAFQESPSIVVFGRDSGDESYEGWLVRKARAREENASLPSAENATIVTPMGRYSYDKFDTQEIARVLALVEGDLPGIDANDLRATLASVEPGRTFTIEDAA